MEFSFSSFLNKKQDDLVINLFPIIHFLYLEIFHKFLVFILNLVANYYFIEVIEKFLVKSFFYYQLLNRIYIRQKDTVAFVNDDFLFLELLDRFINSFKKNKERLTIKNL